jgi:oligopeptide transport system permease protein
MNKSMVVYIVKRLLMSILTVFCVITITFFVMQAIPGGPFSTEGHQLTPIAIANLTKKFGLDQPLYVQYFKYLKGALIWDFGPCITLRGKTVMDVIKDGFATSGKIGALALLIALFFGIIGGSIAAFKQNKFIDRIIMVISTASVATPSFIIATLFLLFFCVRLHWFPTSSATGSSLAYVLPVFTLSLYPAAYITRMTRSSTLDVLNQDFIRTARAKGLPKRKIIFKHALRNSLTPIITYVGPEFAYIITGSLVVEQVFSIPGLGRYYISSITSRDYPLIMGTTIFLTYIMVIMLLVSDILYVVANPKISLDD